MSNDVSHTIASCTLGWKPLETERKKSKEKMMYKIINEMGPKSLSNLFSYTCEKSTNNTKNSFM